MDKKNTSFKTIADNTIHNIEYKRYIYNDSDPEHDDYNAWGLCKLVAYLTGKMNLVNNYRLSLYFNGKNNDVISRLNKIDETERLGLNKSNRKEIVTYLTDIFNKYLKFEEIENDCFIYNFNVIRGELPKEIAEEVNKMWHTFYKADEKYVKNEIKNAKLNAKEM